MRELQAVYAWNGDDRPTEEMYACVHHVMDMADLKRVLARLRVQSAAGLSGLSYAILLSAPHEFLEVCLAFCNLFLRFGGLGPQQWRHSDITAIPKSSEVGQGIDASQPIGLMEVLGKVVMLWLNKQVTQV